MTLVAAQIRVAGTGEVYIGDVGTAVAPVDATAALDASWKGLGYDSDNGLTISRSMNVNDIAAWQALVPVRRVPQDQAMSVAGEFMQSSPDVYPLYMATSAFAAVAGINSATDTVATADVNPAIVEKAVVYELVDGSIKYRIYIPKAQVSANGDQTASRTAAVLYPLMFTALAPDTGTDLFQTFTNDPAMLGA